MFVPAHFTVTVTYVCGVTLDNPVTFNVFPLTLADAYELSSLTVIVPPCELVIVVLAVFASALYVALANVIYPFAFFIVNFSLIVPEYLFIPVIVAVASVVASLLFV